MADDPRPTTDTAPTRAALAAGRPGLYQLADVSEDTWRSGGWEVHRLDPVSDLRSFYGQFRQALGVPDWFGRNLDALWEVLLDLTVPTALLLVDWQAMARRHRRDWKRLSDVLEERALTPVDVAAPVAVVLDGDGDPRRPLWAAP